MNDEQNTIVEKKEGDFGDHGFTSYDFEIPDDLIDMDTEKTARINEIPGIMKEYGKLLRFRDQLKEDLECTEKRMTEYRKKLLEISEAASISEMTAGDVSYVIEEKTEYRIPVEKIEEAKALWLARNFGKLTIERVSEPALREICQAHSNDEELKNLVTIFRHNVIRIRNKKGEKEQ